MPARPFPSLFFTSGEREGEGSGNETGKVLLTCWSESQLSANYISIITAPKVMADSAPCSIDTDFNTSFQFICPINKSDVSISTVCMCTRQV